VLLVETAPIAQSRIVGLQTALEAAEEQIERLHDEVRVQEAMGSKTKRIRPTLNGYCAKQQIEKESYNVKSVS
jgi:hypothetical protein